MKLVIRRLVILGLASAATIAGCSTGEHNNGSAPVVAGPGQSGTGTVGAQLTLPSGETINTVNYTLTNGTNTITGTVNVAGATTISFVIPNVPAGSNYTVSLTALTTDGLVSCAGTSAPFTVVAQQTTNVNVQLVCTTTGSAADAGLVLVNGYLSYCATWNTIVANPSSVPTGGTVALTAAGTAPLPASLAFAWSAPTGTLGSIAGTQNGSVDTNTFTCPATPGSITVTVVLSDGPLPDGGSCPVANTTATVTVSCTGSSDAGGTDATLESGSDAPSEAASEAAVETGVLAPCTVSGQTNCVQCNGNGSGLCSPTEAAFVQYDINDGNATSGGLGPNSCYACLYNASCIDDTVFGDTGHECEDLTGNFDGGSAVAECESTLTCILGSNCAASAVSTCYCGANFAGSACASAGGSVDGTCLNQEVAGIGFPASDNTDMLKNYTDTTRPAGLANQIFQCALSNGCTSCQ